MDEQDRIRELCLRWEEAWDRGDDLSAEELCAETPELLPEVRRQVDDLRQVKAFLQSKGVRPSVTPEPVTRVGSEVPATRISRDGTTPDAPQTVPPESPPDGLSLLPTVPGYEILGVLGRGGMGIVYRARHLTLKRIVALKMVLSERANSEELARFRIEAEAVARLRHPNIVQIHEIGEQAGQPWFSLEFAEGGSLDKRIKATPQPPREAAQLLATLARAMHAAHQKGIVHRDLKPHNVLLDGAGADAPLGALVPKVTDFGLAKQLDVEAGHTQSGMLLGTPSYMAPEQAEGRLSAIGPATDVYALGAILYELLTGHPPFKGQTLWETLKQVTGQEPVPPRQTQPSCPRDLETICLKALRKNQQARYASAQALADDLQRFLDGRPIEARPVGPVERFRKWVKRAPIQAGLVGALIGVIALTLVVLAINLEKERRGKALAEESAAKSQLELADVNRQADDRQRIERQCGLAVERNKKRDHAGCAKAAHAALQIINSDHRLQSYELRPLLEELLRTSERELELDRLGREDHDADRALQACAADAYVAATPFGGLDQVDNLAHLDKVIAQALPLFDVTLKGQGPPRPGRRFKPAENRAVAAHYCGLLVLQADALAQLRVGETETVARARLEGALRLLDRADLLGLGQTRASLSCRIKCLAQQGRGDEADRVRARLGERPAELVIDLYFDGLQSYRKQQFAAAVNHLSKALKEDRDNYAAEFVRALCRVQERNYRGARDGLTRCLSLRPEVVWPRLYLGFVEMAEGKYPEALKEYEAVFAAAPEATARYIAHVNRGALRVKQHDWDAASGEFEAAIALRPDTNNAYVNLAVMHRERVEVGWRAAFLTLGDSTPGLTAAALESWRRAAWQTAVATLDRAIARRGQEARLYQERARLHLKLGEAGRARADLTRAVALAPQEDSARLVDDLVELGRLLSDGEEFPQALVYLDAVLKLRPGHAAAWHLKAQALYGLHHYAEAGAALSRYLELAPEKGIARTPPQTVRLREAYRARGLIHVKLSEYREAADSYTRGLELGRTAELLSERGRVYLTLGAPALARFDFEEVLRERREDGDALIGLAAARVEMGDWKKAVETAELGLSKNDRGEFSRRFAPRVFAQAYIRVSAEKTERRNDRTAEQLAARAVELLRQTLPATVQERQAFWREHVEKDAAMKALGGEPAMRRLSAEVLYAGD